MNTQRCWVIRAAGAWLTLLAMALVVAGAHAQVAKFPDPRTMKIPPLGQIHTPAIDRHVLANGMIVYLLEDHDFPVVDCQMLIRTGMMYEPEDKRGLAAVTGEVLRTGGTTHIAGDDLDIKLESMGAIIEAEIAETQGRVNASFLTDNATEGLGIFADVLRNPAFPDDKIELAKVSQRTNIASRNDEPIPIAVREFQQLMFGAHSPYGWFPEYATIEAIDREDLVDFHRTFFYADRMMLTVFGDFQKDEMLALITRTFGDWPRAEQPLPPAPPSPERGPVGVFHAEKEGITQGTVLFGLRGTLASDPDYAALQLLNQILGEGFTSRLTSEIRTKRGLSYAVGSAAGTGWHHPGVWLCYLLIQADSTVTGAELMRREVEKITQAPVTEDELRMAKDIVLNQLVFDFSSKRDVLNRRAFYEYYGYAPDFLETYQQKVQSLTAADLLGAAQRHIKPAEMAIVTVGPKAVFDKPLTSLGPVTEIDIAIPEPPSKLEIPAPTAELLARGQETLAAALKAHGGERFMAIKAYQQKGKGSMSMMGQKLDLTLNSITQLPDKSWTQIDLMFGTIIQASDGDAGWMRTPQGVMDAPPDQMEEARLERVRSLHNFLVHHGEMTWQALEPREFDGVMCDVVYARETPVKEWLVYIDAGTHLVRGMEYRGRGQQGPVHATEILSDYRKVDGVQMAFASKTLHDGEPFLQITLAEALINPVVDAAIFRKPQ
jgi:zinc protease